MGYRLTAGMGCRLTVGMGYRLTPSTVQGGRFAAASRMLDGSSCSCCQSLKFSKQLMRGVEKQTLHEANQRECQLLVERWTSDECAQAVMQFFAKKAKM